MSPGRARGNLAAALATAALAALLPSAAAQSAALDLVLVRVGNAAWPANSTPGTTLPVFADSYARPDFTSNFSLSYTLSAPTVAGTPGQSLCTLPAGTSTPAGGDVRYHDIEGTPAAYFTPLLAQVGAWPCYALPPGASVLTGTGPTVAATIAQLASSGRLDTGLSLRLDDAAPGIFTTGLRSSLSTDVGASFAVVGITGPSVGRWPIWKRAYLNATAYSGPMYGSQSAAAAVPALDLRGFVLSSLDRVTYAYGMGSARNSSAAAATVASATGWVGVWRVDISTTNAVCANASAAYWAGRPVLTSGCVSLLPGFNGTVFHNDDGASSTVRVAWALTFDTSGSLWVSVENADPVTGGRGVLYNYNYDGSMYGFNTDKSRVLSATEPLLSVVSREDRPPGGNRIMWIYVASRSTAYRYDSTNKLAYTLAVAPAGSVFRGVLLQPGGQYTPSITPSTTPTGSSTASRFFTQSASQTPTFSPTTTALPTTSSAPTNSNTMSSSVTQTRTQTGSLTGTPSQSPTTTSSGSQSSSQTGTPSQSPTTTSSGTRSSSQTGTPSQSPRSSSSGTRSSSQTGTPSQSQTGSQTCTPSPSQTGSQTCTPSPSQTGSQSGTPSPSQTGSQTGTPSPSQTGSQTGTPSPSQTGSQTCTPSPSQTGSQTGTPSPSQTRTSSASMTTSASSSSSRTTSPSPTPASASASPVCGPRLPSVISLNGLSGTSSLVTTSADGNDDMYLISTCGMSQTSTLPARRIVFRLNLGGGTPLRGTLAVSTCGTPPGNYTVLLVGTSCPLGRLSFNCLQINDDAGDAPGAPACLSNPSSSFIALRDVATREFYVQLMGYNGDPVTAVLHWAYTPPSLTPTGTGTASASAARSFSATRTRSVVSPSRSRSRTRTRTQTHTRTRSATRSRTRTRTKTGSRTRKPK
jgi:hypothetical protein